jgi:hypothetical protein
LSDTVPSTTGGPARRPAAAIVQSCYIPWKGFFDMVAKVDEFVIYDDVQFVKRHWHNRNRIKPKGGALWLSIPVATKGKYLQNIDETLISEPWAEKHWRSISLGYAKAPFFKLYEERFRALYEQAGRLERLSDVNALFMKDIAALLGITTRFSWSTEYQAGGRKTDRLLDLCRAIGAKHYLSGPAAKIYFEGDKFDAAGISHEWMDYSAYPEYPQFGDEFEHGVSILDLLFHTGPDAPRFMKLGRGAGAPAAGRGAPDCPVGRAPLSKPHDRKYRLPRRRRHAARPAVQRSAQPVL